MAKVRPEDSHRIGQIFPWVLKGNKGEPKSYYDKVIELPFEDATMPVPSYYNTVLSGRYGNYNEIHKVWDGHTYPFFEGQKANLEKINGAPLPGFTFETKMLERPEVDRGNSLKTIANECLEELKSLLVDLEENSEEKLVTSQQLAIDLGTLIEQVKGEDRESTKIVIRELEKFCEVIYRCSQSLERTCDGSDGNYSSGSTCIGTLYSKALSESINNLCSVVKKYIIQRKEVLFLTIGYREWRGFETIYKSYLGAQGNAVSNEATIKEDKYNSTFECDIYVVPLPLLTKDPLGQAEISEEKLREGLQIEKYPDDIVYSDWQSYDVSQHCPDIIYIQNPYDSENPYLTVPPQYYAANLRKYTDKLVFIPFKDTGEFGEKDGPDLYNLKHYAAAPGIIYSDEVVVQSENIKNHYVNALMNLVKESLNTQEKGKNNLAETEIYCDKFCKDIWQEKIKVRENLSEKTDRIEKKNIIYCIGANELSEHGDLLLEAVKKRLETFKQNKDKIRTTITLYPDPKNQWTNIDSELSEQLFSLIDKEVVSGKIDVLKLVPNETDDTALSFDSYYGDSSPLVPAFIMQNKPVMLANYDC